MSLYDIKQKIRHSRLVDNFLEKNGKKPFLIPLLATLNFLRLDELSHSPHIRQANEQSKLYFAQNQDKIQQVLAHLADKKSQRTLKKIIFYRSGGHCFALGNYYNHYFPKDIISLSRHEVFVDCGAFTGDSIDRFKKACRNRYKKIVAFEASPDTFAKLQARHFEKCTCFNCGVWHQKDTLTFCADAKEGDKLETTVVDHPQLLSKKQCQIPVDAIDNIPACADMTFLKMDIEGAELNALKGAEKTIRKNCPTLAISIYHSDQDLLQIPLWIMNLGLPYKYYIRHHHCGLSEVVFYAVPTNK